MPVPSFICLLLDAWAASEIVNANGVAGLMVSPFIGDIRLHLLSSYELLNGDISSIF